MPAEDVSMTCAGADALRMSPDGSSLAVGVDPRHGGLRYDVFISHAGPQKDGLAVWLRNQLRICGRRAFVDEFDLQYGDDAQYVMEMTLRAASVVVVVITQDFMRSRHCLKEAVWAYDEQLRRQHQGQQPLGILPVFYRHFDRNIGFGPDSFSDAAALRQRLRADHPGATAAELEWWLHALLFVSSRTGIRQDSVGRRACGAVLPQPLVKPRCICSSHTTYVC